jgi:hypothetical protein
MKWYNKCYTTDSSILHKLAKAPPDHLKAGCLVQHSANLDKANKYTSLSSIHAELDFFKETKTLTENF